MMEETYNLQSCYCLVDDDDEDDTFKVKVKHLKIKSLKEGETLQKNEQTSGQINVKATFPSNYLHPHHQNQPTRQQRRQDNLFPCQQATHFWNSKLPLSQFTMIQIGDKINKCNHSHSSTHVNTCHMSNKCYNSTTTTTTTDGTATATATTTITTPSTASTAAASGASTTSMTSAGPPKKLPVRPLQIVNKLLPFILLTSLFVNNILIVNSASTHSPSQTEGVKITGNLVTFSPSPYTLNNKNKSTTQLTNYPSNEENTVTIKFTTYDGPTTKSTGIYYDHSNYFPFTSSNKPDRQRRSNPSATNSIVVNTSPVVTESSSTTPSSSSSSTWWTDILHSTNSLHDSSKYKNGGLVSSAFLTPLPLSDSNPHHTSPTESTIELTNYQEQVNPNSNNNSDSSSNINLRVATLGRTGSRRPNFQKFLTYQLKRFIDCRETLIASYKYELEVSVDPFAGNLTDEESLLAVSSSNQATYPSPNQCEGSFDGFNCWIPTDAGSSLTLECPQEFYSSMTVVKAGQGVGVKVTRNCFANGSWDEDVNGYYKKDCNFDPSIINGDPNDMELLERLILDVSKLDSSPFADVRTTVAFEECIDSVLAKPLPADKEPGTYCERTFDGWGCWDDTPANSTAFIPCPTFMPGFLPERMAFKLCLADGTWFRHPLTNKTWSNYTTCIDQEDLSFRHKINNLYIGGYTISVIALAIALVIFFSFTSLRCDRITIHKNLFISFIINNIVWIIWYVSVIYQPDVIVSNALHCQVLHVIVHYFLVCNYFWMFCEGLYLHTLLVIAFVSEERILKWFYVIGWIVPLIFTTLYAVLRSSSPSDTVYCWIEESKYTWILQGPVVISMVLNFFFLVNIVRVLVTKLRETSSISHSSAVDTHQIRKAVRATLILIPLLGLQYVLTPFRPPPGSPGENVYEVLAAIFTSFQGLAVALLFCFFNGEVIASVKKIWRTRRDVYRDTGGGVGGLPGFSYNRPSVSVTVPFTYGHDHNLNNENHIQKSRTSSCTSKKFKNGTVITVNDTNTGYGGTYSTSSSIKCNKSTTSLNVNVTDLAKKTCDHRVIGDEDATIERSKSIQVHYNLAGPESAPNKCRVDTGEPVERENNLPMSDECTNGPSKGCSQMSTVECEVDEVKTTGDVGGSGCSGVGEEDGTISSGNFLVGTLLTGAKCNLNFVVNNNNNSNNKSSSISNNSNSNFVSGSDNRNRSSSSSSSDAWSEKNRRHSSRDGLLPTLKPHHQQQHLRSDHQNRATYIRSESLMSEERKKEKKKHKRVTSSYSLTDEPSFINGYVKKFIFASSEQMEKNNDYHLMRPLK